MPEGIAQRFLTVHFWKSLGAGSLKAVLSVDQWSRYDCGEIRRPISKYKSPFCLHRAAHIEQRGDLGTKRSQYHMEMFSCCAQPVIRLALDYSPDLEFSLMSNSGCVCTCQITQNSFRPCFVFVFFRAHRATFCGTFRAAYRLVTLHSGAALALCGRSFGTERRHRDPVPADGLVFQGHHNLHLGQQPLEGRKRQKEF